MTPQEQFWAWLATQQAILAGLVATVKKWLEISGGVQAPPSGATDAPHEFHIGDKVVLKTVPLSDGELTSLQHEMAEAVVREKAIEFVKGFLFAVAVGAGPFGGSIGGLSSIAAAAGGGAAGGASAGAAIGCTACGGAV